MNKIVLISLLIGIITILNGMSREKEKIDDWEYNASMELLDTYSPAPTPPLMMNNLGVSMSRRAMTPKTKKFIGLSVGGAKDTNNFKANIDNGYLPKLDSITYEGQFYHHYFNTGLGKRECKALFCPSYSSAKRLNIFSKEKEYFLSVGLNSGIETKDFKRKKMNLVVVLDISGSMGASFDSYYYDKTGKKIENEDKEKKTKIEIATESIVAMLSHLKDDDRVGMVLFDDNAYRAKPLRLIKYTEMDALKKHILELKERGGTNWSAGYSDALKLFENLEADNDYENRIVFLTDAMPNMGELNKGKLFSLAKKASERGIYTTFIGIGVDFNNDLVEYVSKTKGANYFSVHSSKKFKKLLDKEFEYMVTPLVYDLELKLESEKYQIDAVYGSPDAKLATGEIMKVNTLFPSSNEDGETKGGVILLKLKKVASGSDDIKLKVSYRDRDNKLFGNEQIVEFNTTEDTHYDNFGIRKAILVSDYVTIMKNWLIDTRASCNDNVKWIMEDYPTIMKRCMVFPPKRPIYPTVKTWERKSCKLTVSEGYHQLFKRFRGIFLNESKILDDDSLEIELEILDKLISHKVEKIGKKEKKNDDWEFVQE